MWLPNIVSGKNPDKRKWGIRNYKRKMFFRKIATCHDYHVLDTPSIHIIPTYFICNWYTCIPWHLHPFIFVAWSDNQQWDIACSYFLLFVRSCHKLCMPIADVSWSVVSYIMEPIAESSANQNCYIPRCVYSKYRSQNIKCLWYLLWQSCYK